MAAASPILREVRSSFRNIISQEGSRSAVAWHMVVYKQQEAHDSGQLSNIIM